MHLAEMSKLQPEGRLGCCTLQLDFPRRSGTYSDLVLCSIFPLRAALRAISKMFRFHVSSIGFCKVLERILLGTQDIRIRHFRMIIEPPCRISTPPDDYRQDFSFLEIVFHRCEIFRQRMGSAVRVAS